MKNLNKKKYLKNKYIIIVLSLFTLFLIILSFSLKRDNVSEVELFFKGTINKIQEILYLKKDEKVDFDKHVYEKRIDSLNNEVEELKGILNLNTTINEYKAINATVLYRNVGYWYETITVNKGEKNGVKEGMLCMTEEGIIGRIINVSGYSSDIRLLTSSDENSRITVAIETSNTTAYGLISRYDSIKGELLVDNITTDIEYEDNIKITSSGLTGSYPKGIIIGYVKKIEKDKTGLSLVLRVKAKANFNYINYVTILGSK